MRQDTEACQLSVQHSIHTRVIFYIRHENDILMRLNVLKGIFVTLTLIVISYSALYVLVPSSSPQFEETTIASYIQDGDTFQTSVGDWIRLADVDTPEQVYRRRCYRHHQPRREEGMNKYQRLRTQTCVVKRPSLDIQSESTWAL